MKWLFVSIAAIITLFAVGLFAPSASAGGGAFQGSNSYAPWNWRTRTGDTTVFTISEAGRTLGGAGTVALPAWTFTSDTDSGVYRIGANNIGVAVNAAKVLDVSTTGLGVVGTILNGNGSVTLPAYGFTSDAGEGLYRIGANNTGWAAAGAKVLDVSAAGLGVTGALTVSTTVTATGGVAAAGGFSVSPRNWHTGASKALASTDGTNLSAVVTELYVAEVFVPANATITGASVFWGDATEGNAKVALFNSAGARVALSASTDVSGFTADSYGSRVPFSAPYAAVGPATYYIGVICDSSSNRINTHVLGDFGAGKITGLVYATEAGYATITVPTTFTTGLGPIASLY